jgi:murein L,D-transpeptidase YcbB/YkuD
MKPVQGSISIATKKAGFPVFLSAGVFLMFFSVTIYGSVKTTRRDTSIQGELKTQLDVQNSQKLYFPNSVRRFYAKLGFAPAWVKPLPNPGQTWEAMLMLDCVLQFGLSHDDYHPSELLYDRLHAILEKPDQISNASKAQYDILLTDALLTFINYLHYGKLNPEFTVKKIDAGNQESFAAETSLLTAMQQKEFMKAVLKVQPQSKMYAALQYQMHLLKGVYQSDCYDIPETAVRKIAINMERLRWAAIEDGSYLQVNIPSYSLKLFEPDTTYEFRIIVGKPSTPTPVVNSAISYFTTAAELKIPTRKDLAGNPEGNAVEAKQQFLIRPSSKNPMGLIYFWFANKYGLSLEGRPEKALFKKRIRALSSGSIKVEKGELFAQQLLKRYQSENSITDLHQAIVDFRAENFMLTKTVPIKITYITCEMKDGVLITYDDIYHKDLQLEKALYNAKGSLAIK